MTKLPNLKRVGFFTRLLDETSAAERYRLATAQIAHAERWGFDSAWIAQHHFHEGEGGLPAPFVFLAQAAARTSRIRLGTGIIQISARVPAMIAMTALTMAAISNDRFILGLGASGPPGLVLRLYVNSRVLTGQRSSTPPSTRLVAYKSTLPCRCRRLRRKLRRRAGSG